jgi:hypothetical protein
MPKNRRCHHADRVDRRERVGAIDEEQIAGRPAEEQRAGERNDRTHDDLDDFAKRQLEARHAARLLA